MIYRTLNQCTRALSQIVPPSFLGFSCRGFSEVSLQELPDVVEPDGPSFAWYRVDPENFEVSGKDADGWRTIVEVSDTVADISYSVDLSYSDTVRFIEFAQNKGLTPSFDGYNWYYDIEDEDFVSLKDEFFESF